MTLQEKLRWDFTLPFERAEPPPVHWFTDPEIFALAQRCIFRDAWQIVARADQLATPGAFVTAEVGGAHIRVRRSDAGNLRALSMVCAHQHALLKKDDEEGVCKETFACPNHRAVYAEDGTLLSIPECQNIEALHARGTRLREFPVATWGPLVAVHLGKPQEEFAEIFSPVPEWCHAALREVLFYKRMEYTQQYSVWQALRNYLDKCSHCLSWHQRLVQCFDLSRRHVEMFPFGSVQRVPFKLSDDPSLTAIRSGREAWFFCFWPNLAINFNGDGVVDVNHFIPLGPDRCRVVIDTYYYPSKSPSFKEESLALTDSIQKEDNGACTLMQTGIEDPCADPGFYSVPNDVLIHQWHQMLAKALWKGFAVEEGGAPHCLGRCCD